MEWTSSGLAFQGSPNDACPASCPLDWVFFYPCAEATDPVTYFYSFLGATNPEAF